MQSDAVDSAPELELLVEPYQSGLRVDAFLSVQLRNYSVWRIQRLFAWGMIRVNHQPADLRRRLWPGETVQVRLIEPPEAVYESEPFPLQIVFEDPWIVVVNKPPGVIAHPTGTMQSGTLCQYMQHHLDEQSRWPGLLRPGIVHRLDRETSGVIVIAKTHLAHRRLVDAFEKSRVSKTYLAIVEGSLADDQGVIDLPIGQARIGTKVLMTARGDALRPKPAQTSWRVLRRLSGYTVVAAKPVTGRNHQIRVHFAAIGHPLAGDEFYLADGKFKASVREDLAAGRNVTQIRCPQTGLRRHALHAMQLETAHPMTNVWMTFRAELAIDLRAAIGKIESQPEQSADNGS